MVDTFVARLACQDVVSSPASGTGLLFLRLRSLTVAVSDNIYILLGVADGTYAFDRSSLLAARYAGRAFLPVTDHPSTITVHR